MTGHEGTSIIMPKILLSYLCEEVGEYVLTLHAMYHSTMRIWNLFAGALLAEGNASMAPLMSQRSDVFQNYSEAAMQTPGSRCGGRGESSIILWSLGVNNRSL